ncbi:hypothetical protein [Desulfuribacillus alkaliarsenatis]|uniref:Uncharacterized protein n=1 Tax=Desulfuribacillus alkaliarsenatis TaxID=766136 RepID=A0A1E5G512_9FIRM|nr:hypothetical protein [Desulfuribacillus alkaliarsenatis]OEF98268.1 hypothetical protein BHF68_00865 [Desulfuribacillus alkaliarsenatis]
MYFHGIKAEYLQFHFPIINPVHSEHRRSSMQLTDGQKLKERFGFEPVHLLQSSDALSKRSCIKQCSRFGDTVFVFENISLPILYLSKHERGVAVLDLRDAIYCYTTKMMNANLIKKYLPNLPIRIDSIQKNNTISNKSSI